MPILRLEITDFRNLASAKIEPIAEGFNFFHGYNGSGKTSLLEAIYYLGRGRSFRSSSVNHIINNAAENFSIFAQIRTESEQIIPVGMERMRDGGMRVRISGRDSNTSAEILHLTPSLLINSTCFSLLDAGPIFRRKYLDWGAFYLTSDFFTAWKTYERILKQRNAALRERRSRKEVEIWSIELISAAIVLDGLRRNFVSQLLPFLNSALSELLEIPNLKMTYYPGWDDRLTYQEALTQGIEKDSYGGYTHLGPHRADLKISVSETPAKDILSRGQQKLFICAMIVAKGAMLHGLINRKPIYLIDDLPSELDSKSRAHLIDLLARQSAQVFVTMVEREELIYSSQVPMKMFHVEHGSVREEN